MPIAIKRIGKNKYKVYNRATGEVHAKRTSKDNAESQKRLLDAVDHGWKPTGKT